MIIRLLFTASWLLIAACDGFLKQPVDPVPPTKPEVKSPAASPKAAAPARAEASLDPAVMFMVMVAELAGQRGRYDIALDGYLEAARRVSDPRFAERATAIALYIKDWEQTDEAVRLWLRHDKTNPSAFKIAALSALIRGDQAAAVDHLAALLAKDPAGLEKTAMELAAALHREGKLQALYDAFVALSAAHPKNADMLFVKTLLSMQMDNREQALASLRTALAAQPGWGKLLILQAQVAMLPEEVDKAVADLKAALAKTPDSEKLAKTLARLLVKAKDYPKARQIYQQLANANPDDKESLFASAVLALQLEDHAQARTLLEGFLQDPQWRDQANFYLAKLAEKQGRVDDALARYEKVADEPLAFEAGLSAVSLLAKERQFHAAQAKLTALSGRFPKQRPRLMLTEAELLNQQRNHRRAFEVLTDALRMQPNDKALLYARALMAERIGQLGVMEADLNKILAQDPNNAEALNALGYALTVNTTRYKEAEALLARALELAPDEGVILDSYGWLQFKLGNKTLALDYLRRAYAKQPVGEIAAHLAEVLWALGKREEARAIAREAMRREPDNEYLLEVKRRVLAQESPP